MPDNSKQYSTKEFGCLVGADQVCCKGQVKSKNTLKNNSEVRDVAFGC